MREISLASGAAYAVGMDGNAAVTNGSDASDRPSGAGTTRPSRLAYAIAAIGPTAFCLINIWATLHDRPELSRQGRSWEVVSWETSSALMTIVLMPIAAYAVSRHSAGRPKQASRAVIVLGSWFPLFFALHVGGFILIRQATYAMHGSHYRFGGIQAWLYELPKDAVTYVILVTVFVVAAALRRKTDSDVKVSAGPATMTIRDGTRTILVSTADIMAVSAAGNYVEVRLTDGRAPLMRSTLAALERRLGPHGFVRTHRSWLVNESSISEIVATGGGDYQLRLSGGVNAPVSRQHARTAQWLRRHTQSATLAEASD
jgi:hypothetical protein